MGRSGTGKTKPRKQDVWKENAANKGLVRLQVWVPEAVAEYVKMIAEELRERYRQGYDMEEEIPTFSAYQYLQAKLPEAKAALLSRGSIDLVDLAMELVDHARRIGLHFEEAEEAVVEIFVWDYRMDEPTARRFIDDVRAKAKARQLGISSTPYNVLSNRVLSR